MYSELKVDKAKAETVGADGVRLFSEIYTNNNENTIKNENGEFLKLYIFQGFSVEISEGTIFLNMCLPRFRYNHNLYHMTYLEVRKIVKEALETLKNKGVTVLEEDLTIAGYEVGFNLYNVSFLEAETVLRYSASALYPRFKSFNSQKALPYYINSEKPETFSKKQGKGKFCFYSKDEKMLKVDKIRCNVNLSRIQFEASSKDLLERYGTDNFLEVVEKIHTNYFIEEMEKMATGVEELRSKASKEVEKFIVNFKKSGKTGLLKEVFEKFNFIDTEEIKVCFHNKKKHLNSNYVYYIKNIDKKSKNHYEIIDHINSIIGNFFYVRNVNLTYSFSLSKTSEDPKTKGLETNIKRWTVNKKSSISNSHELHRSANHEKEG